MTTKLESSSAQHTAPLSAERVALGEWWRAMSQGVLWMNLALEDLRDRYRRTALGLVWVILSFALFVVVKVAIFGQLSDVPFTEFGLYVAIGFGLWTFISSMVLDACTAYIHARPWILGTATPYPVFLLQAVIRNWMTFAMVMLVMAVGLAWKQTAWTPAMLWSLPALAAYAVTSVWIAALLSPLCARYRDLHHAMQTFMRLLFFATPILWMPASNGRLAAISMWNPASHFVAIVRDPLLYDRAPWESWGVVLAINLVGLPLGLAVYARTRRNIIFWV